MYDWKKIKEKWIVLVDWKKTYRGKEFFVKTIMNRKGNTICFRDYLDEKGDMVYGVEMYSLDRKTGKAFGGSPIWEQHKFATEKELLDKVRELKKKY